MSTGVCSKFLFQNERNLSETISALCDVHAAFEWTIEKVRSLQTQQTGYIFSDKLAFSDCGFGHSFLCWSLAFDPDCAYENEKDEDPKFVGLYLCLTGDYLGTDVKVPTKYTMSALMPKTGFWEAVLGSARCEFSEFIGKKKITGGACVGGRAIAHTDLFGEASKYLSDEGSLTIRAVIDFDIPNDPTSHHVAALCQRQSNLYMSPEFSDFVLVSSDKVEFPVHRSILSAHSAVFRAMFKHGTKEKKLGAPSSTTLMGRPWTFYSQQVKNVPEKVLMAADKYDVSDLRDFAVKYLSENLAVENAYRLSVESDQRNLPKLRKAVSEFILKNWDVLRQTPEFLDFKTTNGPMYDVVEAACNSKKRKIDSV